jgi:hypothetical protein
MSEERAFFLLKLIWPFIVCTEVRPVKYELTFEAVHLGPGSYKQFIGGMRE